MPGQNLRRSNHKLALRERFEHRLGEEARFIKTWFEKPLTTGAVSPSGPALARAMARYVDPGNRGPIVELGPGTGPVTDALIRRGINESRLILVEYNAEFARRLGRRYPAAHVIHGDAYALNKVIGPLLAEPAAAVVSSLPLMTKPERKRAALLDAAFELMVEGGPFIQFTYAVVSPIPKKLGARTTQPFTAEPSPPVWLNLPPARVWVYRRVPNSRRIQEPRFGSLVSHQLL